MKLGAFLRKFDAGLIKFHQEWCSASIQLFLMNLCAFSMNFHQEWCYRAILDEVGTFLIKFGCFFYTNFHKEWPLCTKLVYLTNFDHYPFLMKPGACLMNFHQEWCC